MLLSDSRPLVVCISTSFLMISRVRTRAVVPKLTNEHKQGDPATKWAVCHFSEGGREREGPLSHRGVRVP